MCRCEGRSRQDWSLCADCSSSRPDTGWIPSRRRRAFSRGCARCETKRMARVAEPVGSIRSGAPPVRPRAAGGRPGSCADACQLPARFCLEHGDELHETDQGLVFSALAGGQFAFAAFLSEPMNPTLEGGAGTQGCDPPGHLGREAFAERSHQLIEQCGGDFGWVDGGGFRISLAGWADLTLWRIALLR